MHDGAVEKVYQAFGKLVRLHRERLDGMTQEKLGKIVGLSRTSITNIEKGRQHVSLHHIIAIAEALKVRPHVLLPSEGEAVPDSRVAKRLPPGTEREIAEWAEKLVGD
jgi:DNA-binding XRE family transcriptional regulator